jgi:hypothetical protein
MNTDGRAPQQAQEPVAPAPVGGGLGGFLSNLLAEPDKVISLVNGVIGTIIQAKVGSNPLAVLNHIAQTQPQLLSLYAPNPWGSGFQKMMADSYEMGMRVASRTGSGPGDSSKKGPGPADEAGPPAISSESWPKGPDGSGSWQGGQDETSTPICDMDQKEFERLIAVVGKEHRRRKNST